MSTYNKFGRYQLGQSMIEYTVVIVFGILTLTTGPMKDQTKILMDKIRENYRGYSFAISISDIPDSDTDTDYWTLLDGQNVSKELKQQLTDRTSNNQARSPTKYQDEIKKHNIAPPNVVDTIRQGVRDLRNAIP